MKLKNILIKLNNVSRFLIVSEKCACVMNMFLFSEKDKAIQRVIY